MIFLLIIGGVIITQRLQEVLFIKILTAISFSGKSLNNKENVKCVWLTWNLDKIKDYYILFKNSYSMFLYCWYDYENCFNEKKFK